MIIERIARPTLTAVEMLHGDNLNFRLPDGRATAIELTDTGAEIMQTTLKQPGVPEPGAKTTYRFWGDFRINGRDVRLEREVGTQQSFYEPWVAEGVQIWLDAVDAVFDFMQETHGPCRLHALCNPRPPARKHARLAVQDAAGRVCPERVHPWCPLPAGGLDIRHCYRGAVKGLVGPERSSLRLHVGSCVLQQSEKEPVQVRPPYLARFVAVLGPVR